MNDSTSEAINRVINAQEGVVKAAERMSSRLYLIAAIAIAVAFIIMNKMPLEERLAGTFFFALVIAAGVFFLRHVFLIKHAAPRQADIEKLKANPVSAPEYLTRGSILLEWGESLAAIHDFEEVLRLEPGDENAYYLLGEAYFEIESFDNALEIFDKIIPLDNGYLASAHYYRGMILDKRSPGKGEDDFRKAVGFAPRDPDILFTLADFLLERDRLDEARELIAGPAQELEMQNYPELHKICGTLFMKCGEYDKATTSYTRAMKLGGETKELCVLRAKAYDKLGNIDLAERDRTQAASIKDEEE